jgi:beta-galactosidase
VEKFHGAVIDHVGTEHTRIFKAVQTTGATLKVIDEIAGSSVQARVAIIYDWESRWALDDAQGFQKDKQYSHTCVDYYTPLWKRGVAVDIIGPNKDFDQYDLVIAPMQYMTDRAMIDKIERYVKNGGYFYATYMLGMVNETDLCYLGGFPAEELKDVFGIWNEEIDTLYPEERGEVEMEGIKYPQKDYAELIHANTATVLARYTKEFYAGMPAFTVNAYGKGKAFYQAFRDTGEFTEKVLSEVLAELNVQPTLPCLPIQGVTAHSRTDGENTYLFVENYTDKEIEGLSLGEEFINMITSEKVSSISLEPYSITVLKKKNYINGGL